MNNEKFSERQVEIMEAAAQRIDKHGIQDLTTKTLANDLNLSEAALYRHFKSKNDILLGLLTFFIEDMRSRFSEALSGNNLSAPELLKALFRSQLQAFLKKPAIVSVVFSEGIFQFNKDLSNQVAVMRKLMQQHIEAIIKKGQAEGTFKSFDVSILVTIIVGAIRITVLKWKLSGHKTDLVKDANKVLNGILKMIEIK